MTHLRRHLQLIAVVLGLFVFVGGALPAAVAAKPVKDVRPTAAKVLTFEESCTGQGGKSSIRPSAMDDGKVIANCSGGPNGILRGTCIYTATTSDCWSDRRPK